MLTMTLETIIKWIIPTVLTAVTGYIVKELRDNRNNNFAFKNAIVMLLRSHIVTEAEKYIKLGYLPDYARSCLGDLLTQYKALGGNHGVETMVQQCFNLPPINIAKKIKESEV